MAIRDRIGGDELWFGIVIAKPQVAGGLFRQDRIDEHAGSQFKASDTGNAWQQLKVPVKIVFGPGAVVENEVVSWPADHFVELNEGLVHDLGKFLQKG